MYLMDSSVQSFKHLKPDLLAWVITDVQLSFSVIIILFITKVFSNCCIFQWFIDLPKFTFTAAVCRWEHLTKWHFHSPFKVFITSKSCNFNTLYVLSAGWRLAYGHLGAKWHQRSVSSKFHKKNIAMAANLIIDMMIRCWIGKLKKKSTRFAMSGNSLLNLTQISQLLLQTASVQYVFEVSCRKITWICLSFYTKPQVLEWKNISAVNIQ